MTMLLSKAIMISTKYHDGQVDKGGNPYILHPLRVMMKMDSLEEKIVAVLHDVIEDTTCTAQTLLEEGFSPVIVDAVLVLTRRDGETYKEFIKRCKGNEIARKVKLKDIEDNRDLSRIKEPTETDFSRIKRYEKAEIELLA